jgi:hypothetical protein
VLPYYVVSPSEAGAEISAAQLGRKIVSLSRSDHGWVATMTTPGSADISGYGIQADVLVVEMTAAQAAALREKQINDLSPSSSVSSGMFSSTCHQSHLDSKSLATAERTILSRSGDQQDAQSAEQSHSRSHNSSAVDIDGGSLTNSHSNTPRTFAEFQSPRIVLRILAAKYLPLLNGMDTRLFVTVTLHSPTGELTVYTNPVLRTNGIEDSSSGEESPTETMPDAAFWNEEFVLDVQPDTIYHSKVSVDLNECTHDGEHLTLGSVQQLIGLEDLVRARQYSEWLGLVDCDTRQPLLGVCSKRTLLCLAATFRPTCSDSCPFSILDDLQTTLSLDANTDFHENVDNTDCQLCCPHVSGCPQTSFSSQATPRTHLPSRSPNASGKRQDLELLQVRRHA